MPDRKVSRVAVVSWCNNIRQPGGSGEARRGKQTRKTNLRSDRRRHTTCELEYAHALTAAV
eukprot:654940-Prymnesium_polylepis.1